MIELFAFLANVDWTDEIPGATLIVVEGMGYVLSPNSHCRNVFADALISHTAD